MIRDIRRHLVAEANMEAISRSSIMRILKQKLRYSYKKLCKLKKVSTQPQNIRKFFESAILQLRLEQDGYEIIYLDQFALNSKRTSVKG